LKVTTDKNFEKINVKKSFFDGKKNVIRCHFFPTISALKVKALPVAEAPSDTENERWKFSVDKVENKRRQLSVEMDNKLNYTTYLFNLARGCLKGIVSRDISGLFGMYTVQYGQI
jgi:hypothetical protein